MYVLHARVKACSVFQMVMSQNGNDNQTAPAVHTVIISRFSARSEALCTLLFFFFSSEPLMHKALCFVTIKDRRLPDLGSIMG